MKCLKRSQRSMTETNCHTEGWDGVGRTTLPRLQNISVIMPDGVVILKDLCHETYTSFKFLLSQNLSAKKLTQKQNFAILEQ